MTHTSIIAYLIKIARHKIAIPRSRFAIALSSINSDRNPQAIPRSRFAIALYQSNPQAIPRSRFAIALPNTTQQAIALLYVYQSSLTKYLT
ncbi:hypothetical protein [Aphanizomenon sp. UHCC 0183]|uniref:hypothetical protein n=1 Tax=Aphanizomenon sp. UHCC 0183 TaxID=2590028 RepID=UPI0014478ACC|nr:hypothetical protein [Aphanizomenon sp. UHCC 0183]MTJ30260.1 hypothetical protein [Aphanizomenon sp. UHCC 0183]